MKALCIVGSPKEQGNTSLVVDKIIKGMNESGIETTKHVLGNLNINYCRGCEVCSKTRHCVQKDDMDIIFKDIFESDIILVAAPSYWGDVPGQLKVFIDRCLPLCNASTGETPVPKGKIGISVAIRAGQRKEENQHLIDTIEHFFGHLDIKPVEKFTIEGISKTKDFDAKLDKLEEAYSLGKNLLKYNQEEIVNEKSKQNITGVWDKVAPTFGKIGPNYWNYFGKRLVELSNINEGSIVLDIGMGRGASLFPALNKVSKQGKAIGIDNSEIMVSETSKDIFKQNINNAEVIVMNAENLNFDNNYFDNVICGFSIGILLINESKLSGIFRVLKNGGEVSFSTWGIQEDQKWLTEIVNKYLVANSSNENNTKKTATIKISTLEDMQRILEDTGFTNIRVYEEHNDVIYKNEEEWWQEMWSNAVRGVFERIENLGNDIFLQFKKDVFNGLQKFKTEDGFKFDMPVIYSFGQKQ